MKLKILADFSSVQLGSPFKNNLKNTWEFTWKPEKSSEFVTAEKRETLFIFRLKSE